MALRKYPETAWRVRAGRRCSSVNITDRATVDRPRGSASIFSMAEITRGLFRPRE